MNTKLSTSLKAGVSTDAIVAAVADVAASNSSVTLKAKAFAKRAADDAELTELSDSFVDAGETVKRSALLIMFRLRADYGDDMALFPKPDTAVGDADCFPGNPDKYKVKSMEGGKEKTIQGSYYKDFVAALPTGKVIVDALEDLAKAIAGDASASAEMKEVAKSAFQIKATRQRLDQRLSNLAAVYKRAVNLHLQLEKAKEVKDHVLIQIQLAPGQKGEPNEDNISSSTTPIVVADNSNAPASWSNFKAMSVGQFIGLNLNAGDYEKIITSSAKGTDERNDDEGDEATSKFDLDMAEEYFAKLATFFDNGTDEGRKHMAGLLKRLDVKAEGSDHYVLTVGNLCMTLDAIWTKIEDRYQTLASKAATA